MHPLRGFVFNAAKYTFYLNHFAQRLKFPAVVLKMTSMSLDADG